jgi:hypothetical protein
MFAFANLRPVGSIFRDQVAILCHDRRSRETRDEFQLRTLDSASRQRFGISAALIAAVFPVSPRRGSFSRPRRRAAGYLNANLLLH